MGQDQLSKEEAMDILDQWFHVVTPNQDLWNDTRNFLRLAGDYIIPDSPLSKVVEKRPRHIDRFDKKYDKAFTGNLLLGAGIVDRVDNRVQIFLHSCNTTSLDDIDTGTMSEFGKINWRVEQGKWVTPPPLV